MPRAGRGMQNLTGPAGYAPFVWCSACEWSCVKPTESEARAAAAVHALRHAPRSTTRPTW